jgi:hypothetical protein
MQVVFELLRIVLAALAQAGVAFKAGQHNARQRQQQIDNQTAREANAASSQAGNGERDDVLDELRRHGNLRD